MRLPGKETLERLGGTLELYWWLRHVSGPPTSYKLRWRRWQGWLDESRSASFRVAPRAQQVLFFSVSPAWVDFTMTMAITTAAYGPEVHYAWLPWHSWGPDEPEKHVRFHRWASKYKVPITDERLRVFNLLEISQGEVEPWIHEEARSLSFLDTQYHAKTQEIDIQGNPLHKQIYEHRLERNIECMVALDRLIRENDYSHVVVANGQVMELGACYRTARRHGLRVISFELFEKKGFLGLNDTIPASNADTQLSWAADAPHVLDDARRARVRRILAGREGTDWEDFCVAAQSSQKASMQELKSQLRLGSGPVALLCPNVSWDSSVLGCGRAFSTMAEWVRYNVRYYSEHRDWTLIVRCHPGEKFWGTNEPSENIAKSVFPDALPDNIRVIPIHDTTNTYGLMEIADLGLVYTSTTGLEMAARGLPVVTAGKVHYSGKGFTHDPVSQEQFSALLDRFREKSERLDQPTVDLVHCYLDVYFNSWPRRYPYLTISDEVQDTWSVSRVLSPEGHALFGDTFEFLAGSGKMLS